MKGIECRRQVRVGGSEDVVSMTGRVRVPIWYANSHQSPRWVTMLVRQRCLRDTYRLVMLIKTRLRASLSVQKNETSAYLRARAISGALLGILDIVLVA